MLGLPLNVCLVVAGAYLLVEAVISIKYPDNSKARIALAARISRLAIGAMAIVVGVA